MNFRSLLLWSLLSLVVAATAYAGPQEKKQKQGDEDPFGDLFGDSLGDTKVNLKNLTKDVKKEKRDRGLKAKQAVIKDKISIKLSNVFAAKMIRMDPRRGCVPADTAKMKITSITVNDFPIRSPPFAVCLSIESDAQRSVRITTAVASPRNRKIARSESSIDFRGKPALDHIMEFPPVELTREGQYFYVVEVDGRPSGRLPLFKVLREQQKQKSVPVRN